MQEPGRREPQPAVSCICLTYPRPALLEEAIYSFLQQDYGGTKELIVVNDYTDQVLELDHPEVLVVNVPKRLRTVGEKMNFAVALAAHDILFVWDDDDIYLPHRLRFSVEKLAAQPGFFKPDKAWMWSNGRLEGPARNLFHVGSCWTRRSFDEVSGYPAEGTELGNALGIPLQGGYWEARHPLWRGCPRWLEADRFRVNTKGKDDERPRKESA